MKGLVFSSFCASALLFFAQIEIFACGYPGRVEDITKAVTTDFNRASVVFSGTVVGKYFVPLDRKDNSPGGIGGTQTLIIVFAVDIWWKGNPSKEFILDTSQIRYSNGSGSGAGCEYTFQVGKKYLVYASGIKGKLIAYEGSGTAPIEKAEKDIKELQKLKAVKKKYVAR